MDEQIPKGLKNAREKCVANFSLENIVKLSELTAEYMVQTEIDATEKYLVTLAEIGQRKASATMRPGAIAYFRDRGFKVTELTRSDTSGSVTIEW